MYILVKKLHCTCHIFNQSEPFISVNKILFPSSTFHRRTKSGCPQYTIHEQRVARLGEKSDGSCKAFKPGPAHINKRLGSKLRTSFYDTQKNPP